MSRVYTDTIEPRKATQDITLGTTGETITLPGNTLKTNKIADAGGNNLISSNGSGSLTVNSAFQGSYTLLATHSPSNVTDLTITTNLTSAYGFYLFYFENIVPSADSQFRFQVNGGTNVVSTMYRTGHGPADGNTELSLEGGGNNTQKNTSSDQSLLYTQAGGGAGDNANGELWVFNPAGTTDYKIWQARFTSFSSSASTYYMDSLTAGQFRTASAITSIKFLFSTGNIVSGKIKHYGFKES